MDTLPAKTQHRLAIKNMVCDRCIRVVKEELEQLGFHVRAIALGEALVETIDQQFDKHSIDAALRMQGFELLDDKRTRLVEKIKISVIKLIRSDELRQIKKDTFSTFIEREVGRDYNYLSTLFSSLQGITIEKYIILQRIERVKELLKYDELTLSEIADRLGYSSVSHLSGQFKKVTGLSASAFKKLGGSLRKPLDRVS